MKQPSSKQNKNSYPSQLKYAEQQNSRKSDAILEQERTKWRTCWLSMITELQNIAKTESPETCDVYWIAAGIADKWLQKADR